MQNIIEKLKQKIAVANELREKKEKLQNDMANPKSINRVSSELNDAEKQVEMTKNMIEMAEQGENMEYKKGLDELKTHYEDEFEQTKNKYLNSQGDKSNLKCQLHELNDNIKTVDALNREHKKNTDDFETEPSFWDDID